MSIRRPRAPIVSDVNWLQQVAALLGEITALLAILALIAKQVNKAIVSIIVDVVKAQTQQMLDQMQAQVHMFVAQIPSDAHVADLAKEIGDLEAMLQGLGIDEIRRRNR